LIGGTLVAHASWRWIFLINVPLALAAWIVVATCLRLPRTESGGRLDLPGAAALAGTATCLLLVCQWGGQRYPWLSPQVLALAAAGLGLGAAFGYRQTHSPAPFFPPRLLRHRTLRVISAVQLATGCGMAAATVYVTLDLQLVRRISAARTGVLLLPEHNPVLAAKQAATLDVLSGGRLTLGVGIGWSAEEFAALGIEFSRRGPRTAEYVAAMRALWADDVASFSGEFVRFEAVRVNPKPVRARRIPVVFGGNSDAALKRVAAIGDGWYGFNLTVDSALERTAALAGHCRQHGRSLDQLTAAVALTDGSPVALPELAQAGVTEVVVVDSPPAAPSDAGAWVTTLAARWVAGPS